MKLLLGIWNRLIGRRQRQLLPSSEQVALEVSSFIVEDGTVAVMEGDQPAQRPNWESLQSILGGTFVPDGGSAAKPVWRGEQPLSAGTIIYRGCRAVDAAAAARLLEQPRFWTEDRDYALEYARTCPVPTLEAFPGYLVKAGLKSPVWLADMAMYPLAEALFRSPRRFGIRSDTPQNLQRLHCTDIARTFISQNFDGVIDGREILLEHALKHIEILEIEEVYRPREDGAGSHAVSALPS